jgi:hypothetical protein
MQSRMYLIQPYCHRMLSLASSGLLLLELYLEPHPMNSPCASHALLAIQEHLVLALTLLVSVTPKCYPVS